MKKIVKAPKMVFAKAESKIEDVDGTKVDKEALKESIKQKKTNGKRVKKVD